MRTLAPWMLAVMFLAACSDDGDPNSENEAGGSAGDSTTKNAGGSKAIGGSNAIGGAPKGGSSNVAGRGGTTSATSGSSSVAGTRSSQGGNAVGSAGVNSATGAVPSTGGATSPGGVAGATATSGGASTGGISATTVASAGSNQAGAVNSAGASATAGGVAGSAAIAGSAGQSFAGAAGSALGGEIAGAAGTAGTAGSGNVSPPGLRCGVIRESVVAWWSLDATLTNHIENGKPLVVGPETVLPGYVPGLASGQALDVGNGIYADATDPVLNVTGALTLSAFIKSAAPEGRIIDRITAGGIDGYLLDFYQGRLRMIVGDRTATSTPLTLPPAQYVHVAGVFSPGTNSEIRLYVDGIPVAVTPVAAGDIPSNSLPLRIGADSNGSHLFSGQIDEPIVFSRALSREEIMSLNAQLTAGNCPLHVVTCPVSGLLLDHSESGIAIAGSVECVRANIRNAGDLRVLKDDSLYACDWNGMSASNVSNCQAWVPFATTEASDGTFAPTVPLEWRLFKFNTTGYVDNLATKIEAYGPTFPERHNLPLTWFGRDWRVRRLAVDKYGNATSGALPILADAVRSGAAMGAFIDDWNYAFPHFTAVVSLANDQLAGQDPWHISSSSTSIPGETSFQTHAYHYAVWFDTTGYNYASRWDFGRSVAGSDTGDTAASTFVTEPGWSEVLAHDATGTVTAGSLAALKVALQNGAPLRIASPEGYFDCNRTTVGTDVSCLTYDAYSPADAGNNHLAFDGTHTRMLRLHTTAGRSLKENWSDHSASLASSSDDSAPLRWFVQTSDWRLALTTDELGDVSSGSVADVIAEIQNGADVMVARLGAEVEQARCASLRIANSPPRAACLSLIQVPRALAGGGTNPGYYEARVFNTNGVLARARVAFGSTNNSSTLTTTESLAWFVRH